MMFRGKSVMGSSLVNTAAGLFSLAAGFGASVIVARLLGAEGTGIVAFALYIMILATAVADAGIPQTVLRFVAGSALDHTHRALFSVFTRRFVVTTSLVAAGILGYALWLYAFGDGAAALIWVATTVLFLAYAYSTLSLGVAHGLGQFGAAAKRTLIGCVVQPIAIVVGALLIGPAGAILGYALRHLPQALAISKHLDAGQAAPPPITPAMRTYARYNWLSNALWVTLGSRAELAVIGFYFSFAAVGYYAIGLTINGLVLQLCTFLLASLIPYFGSLHDSEDMPRLVLGYQRGLRWLGLVIAPICFGGAAIAPVLIPAVFGQAFEPAVGMAEILIVFSFAAALTSVPARMMLARQHSAQTLWVSVIWGGISIALMFAVVPHYGGLGAAWIKGAISVVTLASFIWYCRARLDIPVAAGDIVKITAAGVLTAAVARLCIHYVPDLAGMGLGIVAGAVVYCASVLLLSVLPADEKAQLGAWISRHWPARPGSRVGDEVAEQDVSWFQLEGPKMNEVAMPSPRGNWLGQKLLRAFWQIIGPLQDKNYLRLKYFSLTGRFPDLRDPRLFTEKLQVRKLLDRNPLYPVMVDKHAAKALIADRVGSDHVIDTYWVGRDLEDVDWSKIPLPAVVKPTHGSGNGVFLRTRDDIASLLRDNPAPGWLATHHDRINREWAYSQVVPQVIIERMLVDETDVPDDYRFFVFSGKVAMIEVRMLRQGVAYECYFTPDWDRMQVASGYYPSYPHEVPRPARLDDMLEVACKIARDIDFVRADLYCIDEHIYVGELTLYPGGGFAGASPKQLEAFLGDRWTLEVEFEAHDMGLAVR